MIPHRTKSRPDYQLSIDREKQKENKVFYRSVFLMVGAVGWSIGLLLDR